MFGTVETTGKIGDRLKMRPEETAKTIRILTEWSALPLWRSLMWPIMPIRESEGLGHTATGYFELMYSVWNGTDALGDFYQGVEELEQADATRVETFLNDWLRETASYVNLIRQ